MRKNAVVFAVLVVSSMLAVTACKKKSSPEAPIAPPDMTSTATATSTNAFTSTATPPPTATFTRTSSATASQTPTASLTATGTDTPVNTSTSTSTETATPSATPTASSTDTPTDTFTFTPTATFTSTATDTPTSTFTGTSTFTSTKTPTPTATSTPTITFTPTATTCANYGLTDNNSFSATSAAHYYTNQVSFGQATVMDSITLYSYDSNATAETVYVALYDDASGNRMFSGSLPVSIANGAGELIAVPVSPTVALPAGTYDLVYMMPTGVTNFDVGNSNNNCNFDYGTYAGGAPPANYSTLFAGTLFGAFYSVAGNTFYLHACP